MNEDSDGVAPATEPVAEHDGPRWREGRWTLPEPPANCNTVRAHELAGKVALITGGASGIGAGVARRLAAEGAHVVVADVDDGGGEAVAMETGGVFVHCDVRRPEDSVAAVATAEERFGGLDLVHLNAGVRSETSLDDFDLERYRRINAVNLDGVVFGAHAAVPALERRGGGTIVITASVAGLMPVPADPFYTATKHAVVGFCRSIALALHGRGISVQALCPTFTDTPLIEFGREMLAEAGVKVLPVGEVVDAFMVALDSDRPGACYYVLSDRPPAPFPFVRLLDDGDPAPDDAPVTGEDTATPQLRK